MTWRCIWTEPGHFAPDWTDHDTETEAHQHALTTSTRIRGEVAVIQLPEGDQQ